MRSAIVVASLGVVLAAFGVAHFRRQNTVLRFIWPPSDLYAPLASEPLDVSSSGHRSRLRFSPKYDGLHAVKLNFPGSIRFETTASSPLVLEVSVTIDGNEVSREQTSRLSPYWARDGSGFIVHWAGTDRPWPPGEQMEVAVVVIVPDPGLQASYGQAAIRAVKLSDE